MQRRETTSSLSFVLKRMLPTGAIFLAVGVVLQGFGPVTPADVAGLWQVVATQEGSMGSGGLTPDGKALNGTEMTPLCVFEGTMNISQNGGQITGSILLNETGESGGNGACAETLGTSLAGEVNGSDIVFEVIPGLGFDLAGTPPGTGPKAALVTPPLTFEGTVSGDQINGVWSFSPEMMTATSPSGRVGLTLGSFIANRTPEPIPTLSEWGIALLILLMTGAGALLAGRGLTG